MTTAQREQLDEAKAVLNTACVEDNLKLFKHGLKLLGRVMTKTLIKDLLKVTVHHKLGVGLGKWG